MPLMAMDMATSRRGSRGTHAGLAVSVNRVLENANSMGLERVDPIGVTTAALLQGRRMRLLVVTGLGDLRATGAEFVVTLMPLSRRGMPSLFVPTSACWEPRGLVTSTRLHIIFVTGLTETVRKLT